MVRSLYMKFGMESFYEKFEFNWSSALNTAVQIA